MYMGIPQVQDAMKHIPEYLITTVLACCTTAEVSEAVKSSCHDCCWPQAQGKKQTEVEGVSVCQVRRSILQDIYPTTDGPYGSRLQQGFSLQVNKLLHMHMA